MSLVSRGKGIEYPHKQRPNVSASTRCAPIAGAPVSQSQSGGSREKSQYFAGRRRFELSRVNPDRYAPLICTSYAVGRVSSRGGGKGRWKVYDGLLLDRRICE